MFLMKRWYPSSVFPRIPLSEGALGILRSMQLELDLGQHLMKTCADNVSMVLAVFYVFG